MRRGSGGQAASRAPGPIPQFWRNVPLSEEPLYCGGELPRHRRSGYDLVVFQNLRGASAADSDLKPAGIPI
jgi:hypothetical protein